MTYESTTTLERIREASPCPDGWQKLLAHLGKEKADDEPLELLTILDSNGFDDALWVLSHALSDDRLARHFQAWCVEQVLHLYEADNPGDTRVRDQIAVLRNDEATKQERDATWAAAHDATRDARDARAAQYAAQYAAWAVAQEAAQDAARDAAHDAARAARAAARDAQEKQLRQMLKGETT